MKINGNFMASRNEEFMEKCLKQINAATDAEDGLRRLLQYLGETLQCDRVYVFEEMDRQHIRNTYEWCKAGVQSGMRDLPYVAKKDLLPWYIQLTNGENIIEPNVEGMKKSDPFLYEILQGQQIGSIVLSPLQDQGEIVGLLGADNPPPENMEHISVLFDVLAYIVSSLVSRRELQKLRKVQGTPKLPAKMMYTGKTLLLVDDSPELLKCNKRVLQPQGYHILTATTLQKAKEFLSETKPDAIVLDIDLPDGNGIEFCRELNGDIPVVFLTARSDEQAAREGMQAGGCAFLTKPYQLEDLQSAVAAAMSENEDYSATQ